MNESLLAYPFLEKKKEKAYSGLKMFTWNNNMHFSFYKLLFYKLFLHIFTVIWPDCFVVAFKQFRYNTIFTRYSVKINKRKKFWDFHHL